MKAGKDLVKEWNGFFIIHHNLPGNEQGLHAHEEHQVFIPLSGRMTFTDELGLKHKVNRESMFFIPAQTLHAFRSSKEQGERLILMISPRLWQRLVGDAANKMLRVSSNQLVKELAFYLLTAAKNNLEKNLIQTLIMVIGESLETPTFDKGDLNRPQASMDPRIAKAVSYIDDNFSESISVSEVGKICGMSSRNLSRLFQAELSLSPKDYLIIKRIEFAKSRLRMRGASVTETAFDSGYKSLSQFIKSFQKVTGKLPSEYLK